MDEDSEDSEFDSDESVDLIVDEWLKTGESTHLLISPKHGRASSQPW
jgi:hypothetical protein